MLGFSCKNVSITCVQMADALNNATNQSLVVVDEFGKGTETVSTFIFIACLFLLLSFVLFFLTGLFDKYYTRGVPQ